MRGRRSDDVRAGEIGSQNAGDLESVGARAFELAAWPSSSGVARRAHDACGGSDGADRAVALAPQPQRRPPRAAQASVCKGGDRGRSHRGRRPPGGLQRYRGADLAVRGRSLGAGTRPCRRARPELRRGTQLPSGAFASMCSYGLLEASRLSAVRRRSAPGFVLPGLGRVKRGIPRVVPSRPVAGALCFRHSSPSPPRGAGGVSFFAAYPPRLLGHGFVPRCGLAQVLRCGGSPFSVSEAPWMIVGESGLVDGLGLSV